MQDATTSAPDIQAESVIPQKKRRRSKQAQSPTKTVRRRKKPAAANTSDPASKRKSKLVSSTEDVSEPVSLPVSVPGWLKVETQAADQRWPSVNGWLISCFKLANVAGGLVPVAEYIDGL